MVEVLNADKNLNYFSEKLTLELKDILKAQFNTEPNDMEVQEIGRHIAQIVLLKHSKRLTLTEK